MSFNRSLSCRRTLNAAALPSEPTSQDDCGETAPERTTAKPHPLQPLSDDEISKAKDILLKGVEGGATIFFRSIYLEEPKKADLIKFLVAEHGESKEVPDLPRLVKLLYDVVKPGEYTLTDTIIDINSGEIIHNATHPADCQTSFTMAEFASFQDACVSSELFKEAMKDFELPPNFVVAIDPWPYGGLSPDEKIPRYMQGLVFARDTTSNNADSNHYAYPIPIIPVMDLASKKLVRVDRLATGGSGDPLAPSARSELPKKLFANSKAAEYVPELLDRPQRRDLKPINITQPDGASFTVTDGSLVDWQNWHFRVGFTPREGAVLHDVRYGDRPILYRLSFSEMTVPYGDPREPFHRKQAFDFGDGGAGRAANNLQLGCDCLGAIHYLNSWVADTDGKPTLAKNVMCLHEQDNGIGWKHTNYRTDRAVVTRLRQLVLQFVITLANYEYIFAYKFDTAGGITLETRATGIMSVVAIDGGKTSSYGNVMAPGILAQNHQHIFAVRIDPAVDGYDAGATQVVLEESHPVPMNPETNPHGNAYEIRRARVARAMHADAEPRFNRTVRMESTTRKNVVSGKNTGYKFTPSATQLLLADPESTQARRAPFARHHLWVTGHRDGELWAAGEFTNQSYAEVGGVKAMVERGDWFVEGGDSGSGSAEGADGNVGKGGLSSPVVWSVFGLTHNPRVEDWPVMPVEIHQLHIRPADFFTSNPALDVPATKNDTSVLVSCCGRNVDGKKSADANAKAGKVQTDSAAHMQGDGPDVDPDDLGGDDKPKKRERGGMGIHTLISSMREY